MDHAEMSNIVTETRPLLIATVLRTARKYGRNLQDADKDDLVSHVSLVLVSRALPKYNGSIPVPSFVAMVADRETRKQFAKERLTRSYHATEVVDDDCDSLASYEGHIEASDASSPDVRAAAAVEYARLLVAMEALTDAERALLVAIVNGTTREYAAEYGLTSVQMTRAKARVRAKLA